ncbi:MAG: hypothetical protein C0501_28445 [Isosphaera sp.]|nr:hypothetical protein [Isosphaera sp.]
MSATRLAAAVTLAVAATGSAADPVELKGHTGRVTAVAWSADGKALATAGDDRTIRLWDRATGKETAAVGDLAKQNKYVGPVVAFAPDLKTAAVNYWGEIKVRSLPDGKAGLTIDPIADRGVKSAFRPDVFAMAYSPDGKHLATAGSRAAVGGRHGLPGGVVTIWDAGTGKAVHRFDTLSTAAGSVVWTPDGKRVVAGTNGAGGELQEAGEVWVWDAETGKAVHTFKIKDDTEYGEFATVADVAVSPDGKRVAAPRTAGGRANPSGLIVKDTGSAVRVWDLATGKSAEPVKGIAARVGRVEFGPDGKTLVTAGADKVVRVWDAATGKEVAALPFGDEAVEVVAFSPDGKALAAGGKAGAVRVWAVPPAK